jgi:hypothetical protein
MEAESMQLLWGDTYSIIKELFNINSRDIAELFNFSEATVSRFLRHKIKKSPLGDAAIVYKTVFDTANEKSPAYNHNERELLEQLKEIIRHLNLGNKLGDLNEKPYGYRAFVMAILHRSGHGKKQADAIDKQAYKVIRPSGLHQHGISIKKAIYTAKDINLSTVTNEIGSKL